MQRFVFTLLLYIGVLGVYAARPYDNPDTLVVARDGTGQFRTVGEAVEVCRAFMDYHKVIFVKCGVYKEKLIIPSWLDNIEILGEDVNQTVITYDDHANIRLAGTEQGMGTFRTYTLKVEGDAITLKNITIENNSARLGQAVALHTVATCWDIRTLSIRARRAHASISVTATSRVPPISSSDPPPYGLRTARYTAASTPTSQPHQPRRTSHTAMCSTAAA